jgi:hypothetical protein
MLQNVGTLLSRGSWRESENFQMTQEQTVTTSEVLRRIDAGWNKLQAFLAPLSEEQLTVPADPAGWTPKDHLAHLTDWEDSMIALFEGKSRYQHIGLTLEEWQSGDYDKINEVLRQKHINKSWSEVRQMMTDVHTRLVGLIRALPEDGVQRPYNSFDPSATYDAPILERITGNTYEHYDEHIAYIEQLIK